MVVLTCGDPVRYVPTSPSFFQGTGFSAVTSANDAYSEMKRRFEAAEYDTSDVFSQLQKQLNGPAGVNEGFVSQIEDYLERVKNLHLQARRGTLACSCACSYVREPTLVAWCCHSLSPHGGGVHGRQLYCAL